MESCVVVQSLSRVQLFATPWTAACQASCPSVSSGVCPSSWPLNQWLLPTISSSLSLFFCLHSFQASGSFPMNWLSSSDGQSIGASALASVLPMNIQGWFPLELIGLIFLLSKGLSRVFSSATVRRHQFLVFCLLYSPALTIVHHEKCWTGRNTS